MIVVGIFCYALLIIGITYAYFDMQKTSKMAGSAKCNGISYQGSEINASNLSSTTNYLEGAKSTITLSQSDECKIYNHVNIYMHVNDNITIPIDSIKALKYKLITEDKIEYNGTITNKGENLLAVVPLTSDPKKYQIYLWINSEISAGQYDGKSFSGYIYATSEQSSTIGDSEISSDENVSIETIDFDYVGSEQEFIVPANGEYKLETWGAQGGSYNTTYYGGYGGYSAGNIRFSKFNKIYVNCGGQGNISKNVIGDIALGGYNGGGNGTNKNPDCSNFSSGSGGGATHISKNAGLLTNFEKSLNSILIVSGGGGGGNYCNDPNHGIGGAGGGISGSSPSDLGYDAVKNSFGTGGTQNSPGCGTRNDFCGTFGIGFNYTTTNTNYGVGGGGGLYGGGSSNINSAGGGSGYIGSSLLTNKVMYCYNCEESDDDDTKTISTTNVSDMPISEFAKRGNGYARITLIK